MGAPSIFRLGDAVKLHTSHEYWLVCPTHVLFKFGREACTEKRCIACQIRARRPPQLWRHTGMMRRYARHIDRFLMPSKFTRDRHIADGIKGNFTILPHFVPGPIVAPPSDRASGEDPYFLVVGRLEKLKGVQDLLPVFQNYKHARLVIVGSGDYEATLRGAALGHPAIEFPA
jgi:glycosyltransferase involved in cell wall biosynthesis